MEATRVFDVYDDPEGQHLPGFMQKLGGQIPEIEAHKLINAEELQRLPDRCFAIAAPGFRKFASYNTPSTVLSIVYFLNTKDEFSEGTQKIAASNLLKAAQDFDIPLSDVVTEQLIKVAFIGKALGAIGTGFGAADVFKRTKAGIPQVAQDIAAVKQADLRGTEMMPMSGTVASPPVARERTRAKVALLDLIPQTAWEPVRELGSPQKIASRAVVKNWAVGGNRYPIDTLEQIKTAATYLEDYYDKMSAETRHEFARNLLQRAEEIGMPKLAGNSARRFGGTEPGPYLHGQIELRAFHSQDNPPLYQAYKSLEKVASESNPEELAAAIADIDRAQGLDRLWGTRLYDPWESVFKVAEDQKQWAWSGGGVYVTEDDLQTLSYAGRGHVAKAFGEAFATDFQKDPKTVFNSMPDPQKKVLAALTQNNTAAAIQT